MPASAPTSRTGPAAPPNPGARRVTGWMCALIFAVTLAAYSPVFRAGFIWDDAGHVTRPDLQSLHGLWRIWTEVGATQQYYPLLHTAFWFEHRLWGDAPLGYHLLNVLLHATAACLLALTLRRLFALGRDPVTAPGVERPATSGVEWLAALLFALHPVCVESVAWIAEQKNTLSAVLYFCAALAYLRYRLSERESDSESGGDRKRSSVGGTRLSPSHFHPHFHSYVLATLLFVLALLTKTVTATLPAALLVGIWWRRGRLSWKRDVFPLLPWFVLSGAAGWLTAWFERTRIGAQGADFALSWVDRGLLAGRVIWFYLGKLVWPADLIFIYPRWTVDAAQAWQWLFPLGVAVVLGTLVWRQRRDRRAAAGLAGALFFAGTLFPALGFINVYPFIFSFVADHFQYLASVGILTLAAAGLAALRARLPRAAGRALPVLLLAGLGILTWRQSATYRDVFSLYETTLARNPDCWMAQNNLAEALALAGHPAQAVPLLERALQLRPDFAPAENNLGDDLRQLGDPRAAIPHLERALKLQPDYPEAHNNLGVALLMAGRPDAGIAEIRAALRLRAAYPEAHFNLGLALAKTGQPAAAISEFAEAVRLKPDYADAELNWAIGLTVTGRFPEAESHFARALQLEPASAAAHNFYGRALAQAGRFEAAVGQYRAALRLQPDFAEAHLNLALALRRLGRVDEAAAEYREAARLRAPSAGR